MTKVYVVEAGCYSSRRVVAVYSEEQKAKAEELADCMDDGGVKEWELDGVTFQNPGKDVYQLEMKKDGKVDYVYPHARLNYDLKPIAPDKSSFMFRTYKDFGRGVRKSHWRLFYKGYADNEEHAIKMANEIRTQLLAGQVPAGVDMGKNIPETPK